MKCWLMVGLLLLAMSSPAASAGLDLHWNACGTEPGASSSIVFDCGDPGTLAKLYGTFQASDTMPGFVALEVVLDMRFEAPELPPFWRIEIGGCNETAIGIADGLDPAVCPPASHATPWGADGDEASGFITLRDRGRGGDNRFRLLLAIVRASSDPFPIAAGTNYFGFEFDLDTGGAGACEGCATPGEMIWSSGTLYSNTPGVTEVLTGPGLSSNRVTVNGGGRSTGIFAMRPNSGPNDSIRTLTVLGYGIQPGASARLARAGEADIPAENATVTADGSALAAQYDVRERAAGTWDVVMTNPLGDADSLDGPFELIESFRIVSIDPFRVARGGWTDATVHGFGLVSGATIALERNGNVGAAGLSPQVSADGRALTATFDLTTIQPGPWDVVVRQGSSVATLPSGFVVLVDATRLTAITPNRGVDTSVVRATLYGEQFVPGLTARLIRVSEPAIDGTDVVVAADGLTAQATFDLRGRATGPWTVSITNGDSVSGSLPNGFTIVPVRRIFAITPAVGGNTGPVAVILTGLNFVTGVVPQLRGSGLPVIVGTGTVVSGDGRELSTTFPLADRPTGRYDVVVSFPDLDELTLPGAFEVKQGIRAFSIQPATGVDTSVVPVTITGAGFAAGATARLTRPGGAVIPGTPTVGSGDGSAVATSFDLRGAVAGRWDVVVENPDGVAARIDSGFTVLPLPRPVAVAPATAFDHGAVTLTISGSGFAAGAVAGLVRGVEAIAGTGTARVDASTLRTTVNLLGRTPGAWDVEVVNPTGLRGTLPAGFTIVPIVQLEAVSPVTADDTGPVMLTLAGRNLAPGIAAWLQRSGRVDIPGTSLEAAPDGRSLTAWFDVTGAAAGDWDVVARNPDGRMDTLSRALAVRGEPRPVAVAPSASGDFGTRTVTLTGTNFAEGAEIRWERSGDVPILGTAVQVAPDGTSATATLDFTDRQVGWWNVVVVNPGGRSATLQQVFEITPWFRLIAVSPVRSSPAPVSLTVTGRWIAPLASLRLSRLGQADRLPQSGTVAPDGRSLTATFDLTGAALGLWDVVVTNPDQAVATLPQAFAIASTVPEEPLTLLWNGCSQAAVPGQEELVLDCGDPSFRARLFGNFRLSTSLPGVLAISGGLDIALDESALPPFWHFEPGGCNDNGIYISDNPDESVCPAALNIAAFTGSSGQTTDAFVTAYLPGIHGSGTARVLWAIVRASSNPATLSSGNHFGFEIGFDVGDGTCAGCDIGATIGWSWAMFESAVSGSDETVVATLLGTGRYPSTVQLNGGAGDGGAVPVRLSRFEANPGGEGIEVMWEFSGPGEYRDVTVERRAAARGWEAVAAPIPVVEGRMSVVDRSAEPETAYEYRLIATRIGGGSQTFGPIEARRPFSPRTAGIVSVAPNPVTGPASIEFGVARAATVRLDVVDVQGRLLEPILNERRGPGRHLAAWNGRIGGAPAAAGMYFIRCEIEGRATMCRLTVVR